MFRTGRSLLTRRTQDQLKQLARDGFATVAAMSDPTLMATVVRVDPMTGATIEFPEVEVVVRHDNTQATGNGAGLSTAIKLASGTIRRAAPWDIQRGDRVRLDDGRVVFIVAPDPYERFGTMRAHWSEEQGTP